MERIIVASAVLAARYSSLFPRHPSFDINPMKIDLFEFARQRRTASGTVALADLPRIETADRRGGLAWSASGSPSGRSGALRLDLDIDGSVVLVCQRCLRPMTETLALRSRFLIATDENEAERLDQDDDFDVVVGTTAFDLEALVEDEVILALPPAPRHPACPEAAADAVVGLPRPSPFAVLARLKTPSGDRGDGE